MQQKPSVASGKFKLFLVVALFTALSVLVFILAGYFDFLEWFVDYSRKHENWELDEVFAVCIFWVLVWAGVSFTLFLQAKSRQKALASANYKLQEAMAEIKQLKGILPICAQCKKIRDENDEWQPIELYVRDHSQANFSHGLCPECASTLYPEIKFSHRDK